MFGTPETAIERLNAALSDRYRIERELGAGGMATVYLAEDLKHDRKVALKVLKPELAAVVGAERFLAEIRTTANLQHPHILPLFDSGEADGFLYYVMPYIEGETLRDRLDRERQLPVEEAVGIATAVANALQSAHEQGVVHRDIKPANILLSRGEPLVSDFGIALALSAGGGGRLTETGLSLGTPYYMSPEQATGDQTVGPASDVFALGCVLYEMLIGEPPYPGSTAQAVLGKIIQAVPVSATAQRASVPAHVDAAIRKALEKLPADRFTRARDLSAALADRSFRHGVDAAAGQTASAGPWNRLSAGLTALLAVVSVLALWGWFGNGSPPATAEPAVHLAFDLGEYTPTRWQDQVIVSPDGSQFALATDLGGAPGPRVLLYRSPDDLTFRAIPGTEGVEPGSYAFSPDGAWITYVVDDAIMKVSPRGGPPMTVASIDEPVVDGIDWGAEGWIVFTQFAAEPRAVELFRVPDSGGAAERLVGPPWIPTKPRLLPDGSGVVFRDLQSDRLALYDFDADSVEALPLSGSAPMYVSSGHLVYTDGSGGLWAAPFDLAGKSVTGEARLLFEGVSTNGVDARYQVSRSGTLVYERGASSAERSQQRLVVMDLEGGQEILPLEARPFGEARWAPDGRRVLFRSRVGASERSSWQLYVYDAVVRAAPRQITSIGSQAPGSAWSPDGLRVAFSSFRDGTDGVDLFVQSVDGDELARRVVSLPGEQRVFDWTSRGLLLFLNRQGQRADLWVVDPLADDPVPRPYLESEFGAVLPRVSPDGSRVAYISRESGSNQAYVRSFPDPGPPFLVSDGESPVTDVGWSPDGRTVYYWLAAPVGERLLAAARLGPGSPPTVASRDTLRTLPSDLGPWDMHPDGDRFITRRPEATSRQTIVVVNWFDELRRRMGEGG